MDRRYPLALLVVLALAAALPAFGADYVVRPSPALDSLHVEACFPSLPPSLRAGNARAARFLSHLLIDGGPAGSRPAGNRLPLPPREGGACLEYEARVPSHGGTWLKVPAGSVLVDAADWLWRPDDAPLDVRFELPAGMAVSAPWPGNGDRFELPRDPAGGALVAIGRLARRTLKVGGARLRVAILDASPPAPADVVTAWVREGAGAVAAAYGCFPVPAPQVLIVPVGAGDDPVPWGQVRRGGGPAVHLFIDQHRSAEELRADWVLVHEFSHLLHPDFDRDSAWLAEGLASFYQNVLRARAGLLAQRAAFKELHAGFARGRTEVRRGVSLVEASRRMRVDRDYMRVYWSGAAISLLLDLAYRAAGSSLDEALFRFRECCLEGTREWSAAAFLAELDRLTGSGAGSALFREYAHADRFPDLAGAYASLGLLANGDGLKFDPRGSRLRNAVMGAARTLCKPGHARDAQGTAGVPPS